MGNSSLELVYWKHDNPWNIESYLCNLNGCEIGYFYYGRISVVCVGPTTHNHTQLQEMIENL